MEIEYLIRENSECLAKLWNLFLVSLNDHFIRVQSIHQYKVTPGTCEMAYIQKEKW